MMRSRDNVGYNLYENTDMMRTSVEYVRTTGDAEKS